MVTREGVRARHLVGTALVIGAGGYGLLRAAGGASALPSPGWAGVLLLVVMAAGVYAAGLPVRRLRAGRPTARMSPLRAARTLVLAQAAALSGAGLVGWYAAQALLLVPDLDVDSQRSRLWPLLALAAAGVLLVVSGMLVQRMCRLDDDERAGRSTGADPAD
ncbi:MAG: DUF3180 domain-containing protein [Dermatophilaceae bacterium]